MPGEEKILIGENEKLQKLRDTGVFISKKGKEKMMEKLINHEQLVEFIRLSKIQVERLKEDIRYFEKLSEEGMDD